MRRDEWLRGENVGQRWAVGGADERRAIEGGRNDETSNKAGRHETRTSQDGLTL